MPQVSLAGTVKYFLKSWEKLPRYIRYYIRVVDTLQKKTFHKIKKSKGDRHVQRSEDSDKPESFRYVGKRVMGKKGM